MHSLRGLTDSPVVKLRGLTDSPVPLPFRVGGLHLT